LTLPVRARTLFAYVPAIVWAAWILYLGGRTFEPLPELPILPSDKVAHLVLYGVLGLLTVLGWRWSGRRPAVWIPMVMALLIGAFDELRQRGMPARSAELADWIVDAAAILIAFALLARRSGRAGGAENPGK
jgi:VanZ family protein